jgi:hypothetical protein
MMCHLGLPRAHTTSHKRRQSDSRVNARGNLQRGLQCTGSTLAGMYDERRGANVLPAATGGLYSMQPVQPVGGGFMPRGPIRPPPAAPQAQARALSAPAKQPQRSPGIPPTISGPLLREANPMDSVHEGARGPRVQLKMQWRTCSSTWWQRWWLLRSMQLSCAQASRTIPSPHQGHAVGRVAASAEGGMAA